MAKIIAKFSSIKIMNHFVQYREIIVIYCEILKETYIYRVDKIVLRGNSYWLVICWFVSYLVNYLVSQREGEQTKLIN
jgi:hypothetical protein